MTEASPLVVNTSEHDPLIGSSGSLIPGFKAKIIDADGNEVTTHETRGELLVQSPSVVLGYLNNEKANAETFVWHDDGRWLKTGDEVLVRKSSKGYEHFVVVDRIKELIKVKVLLPLPIDVVIFLIRHCRDIKSRQLSSRLTYLPTPSYPIVPLYPSMTTARVRHPKRLSSSRRRHPASRTTRRRRLFPSTLRSTRLGISGSGAASSSLRRFLRVRVARSCGGCCVIRRSGCGGRRVRRCNIRRASVEMGLVLNGMTEQ